VLRSRSFDLVVHRRGDDRASPWLIVEEQEVRLCGHRLAIATRRRWPPELRGHAVRLAEADESQHFSDAGVSLVGRHVGFLEQR
jgi:hypothetical protein